MRRTKKENMICYIGVLLNLLFGCICMLLYGFVIFLNLRIYFVLKDIDTEIK